MPTLKGLDSAARSLIRYAMRKYDDEYGFGSMSCAIYDTAWVSLITRPIVDTKQWVFPECFRYILDRQSGNGGWEAGLSQEDNILNTAASLLSLKRHWKEPLQVHVISQDELRVRIEKATVYLQSQLRTWDTMAPMQVGFEIILPSLLNLLIEEDMSFEFEAKEKLMQLKATKLKGFKPEYLYTASGSTALHSLEAFIGMIDFNRVAHHKVNGSLMGSPSSTAAYLMHVSQWDEEAEAYLARVIQLVDEDGGVPSAYPSTYFEYSWLLSTLLGAGFTIADLECAELSKMTEILAIAFRAQGGTIGFAPYFGSDVDDTAKGLLSLKMLGPGEYHDIEVEPMIEKFEADTHFRTYLSERDPSFSANCNALLALLYHQDIRRYSCVIVKLVQFLATSWWEANGDIKDKWNASPLYSSMLLAEAFTQLLQVIDDGALSSVFDDELIGRVSVALFQACLRPLFQQHANGSWNDSIEQTSYTILILTRARRLCFFEHIRDYVDAALGAGVEFIQSAGDDRQIPLEYLWIEKVTYGSKFLTDTYRIAALKAYSTDVSLASTTSVGASLGIQVPRPKIDSYVKLLRQTPMFASQPAWQTRGSVLEASLFKPLLRARRLMIFPRNNMEKDRYFDMIPCFWVACNNYSSTFASTSFVFELMVISFLNFQADEYMEAVAGPAFAGRLDELRRLIETMITDDYARRNKYVSEVCLPLARFVSHVLEHPMTVRASSWDRENLRRELRIYLLAHVTQTEDNVKFGQQQQMSSYEKARDTFFNWVRTTAANHTSCPYAFALVSCSFSSTLCRGRQCFPTMAQKYFANAACRHLATMCRLYNDSGSVQRDAFEGNLNSVNFPEFAAAGSSVESGQRELLKLAEYERSCLNETLRRLSEEANLAPQASLITRDTEKRKLAIWRLFCDTDYYRPIYGPICCTTYRTTYGPLR
ncbi:hypothetical protein DL771_007004 [Monosporascus sp. 5C6A]|nr:hypothetical protein DL771_007004 [Monosporascus sp. 5C6A]